MFRALLAAAPSAGRARKPATAPRDRVHSGQVLSYNSDVGREDRRSHVPPPRDGTAWHLDRADRGSQRRPRPVRSFLLSRLAVRPGLPLSFGRPTGAVGPGRPTGMRYMLGIDVGGTFTDFVAYDRDTSAVEVWKELSVLADPVAGILKGLERHARDGSVAKLRLGTTLATTPTLASTGGGVPL